LSPIAACVWRHCDGEHDATELAELAGASESLVADALREKHLLDAEPDLMQSTIPGVSRREAISRAARYGAAAAAGSLIVSATAATPAMASSSETVCCSCETMVGQCWCGLGIFTVATCQLTCESNAGSSCKVNAKVTPLAICAGNRCN
jgi:hypothetical protein